MKIQNAILLYIVIAIGFYAYKAEACQLSIPESYVPTFLNPPISGHYQKCESEPCHCVDKINPYFAELIDNEVLDYVSKLNETSCSDELDCDNKFVTTSCLNDYEKIKNYDLLQVYCVKNVTKIEGKKLVESASKKAAYEAKILAEKQAKELQASNKAALKLAIREDVKTATTVAKLKALIEKMIEVSE